MMRLIRMTREYIYAYVGFDRVPIGIEKFFVEEDFERWTPKKGPDKQARAKWRYIDRMTMGHVYGVYQQQPNIQEELIPQDARYAAIIQFEADTGFVPGINDKEVLQAKIEQTVDTLLSKYASLGATRYTQEDVQRRSTA